MPVSKQWVLTETLASTAVSQKWTIVSGALLGNHRLVQSVCSCGGPTEGRFIPIYLKGRKHSVLFTSYLLLLLWIFWLQVSSDIVHFDTKNTHIFSIFLFFPQQQQQQYSSIQKHTVRDFWQISYTIWVSYDKWLTKVTDKVSNKPDRLSHFIWNLDGETTPLYMFWDSQGTFPEVFVVTKTEKNLQPWSWWKKTCIFKTKHLFF